jgi:hypothetical protein
MSAEERPALHQLESDVESELRMVQFGHPEEALALPQTQWLFDPTDVERYRTGLYGLLGAVKALERERDPHPRTFQLEGRGQQDG